MHLILQFDIADIRVKEPSLESLARLDLLSIYLSTFFMK